MSDDARFGLYADWGDLGHISKDGGPLIDYGDPIESFSTSTHDLGGSMDLRFTTEASAEAIKLMAGMTATPRSLLIDTVERVSGRPRMPLPRTGWRGLFDRVTGRQRHAMNLWGIKHEAWIMSGSPDVPVTIRRYISRAHFHTVVQEAPGTWTMEVSPYVNEVTIWGDQ